MSWNASRENCTNNKCMDYDDYMGELVDYVTPKGYLWVLIGVYLLVFVGGLVGNFLVCYAVWKNRTMRTVTNYFIVNLSVADFLAILFCLPTSLLEDISLTWYLGTEMCKILKYLQAVSIHVSVLTLTCISVERWWAICHPFKFKSTTTRARTLVLGTWLISLLLSVPYLVVFEAVPDSIFVQYDIQSVYLTTCMPILDEVWTARSQAVYNMALVVAVFVAPFVLMTFCYTKIIICLWKKGIPGRSERGSNGHSSAQISNAEENQITARRKAAKMLIAIVIAFGLCYLPVHTLNTLRYFGTINDQTEDATLVTTLALVCHCLVYMSSAINPVIYNFMSAKFRQEFKSVCPRCFSKTATRSLSQKPSRNGRSSGTNSYRMTSLSNSTQREPGFLRQPLTGQTPTERTPAERTHTGPTLAGRTSGRETRETDRLVEKIQV